MARYPHYLTKAAGGKWPTTITCLGIDNEHTTNNDGRNGIETPGNNWSAVSLSLVDGSYRIEHRTTGQSSVGFWSYLADMAREPGYQWILGYSLGKQWAATGFYEAIEARRIFLADDWLTRADATEIAIRSARTRMKDQLAPVGCTTIARIKQEATGYLVMEDVPNIARFRLQGSRKWLTWVDIRNYAPSLTCPYLDARSVSAWSATTMIDYKTYCEKYRMGSLQATAGSQAMHGFRHGHYSGGIYAHADADGLRGELQSYHGGRCEAYQLGLVRGERWYCDIRSCYPHVGRSSRLPTRYVGRVSDTDCLYRTARDDSRQYCGTVTVSVETPDYPLRCRLGDGRSVALALPDSTPSEQDAATDTIYPVGTFTTTLAWPELYDAIATGRVVKIHEAHAYECDYALQDYAESLYAWRTEAEAEGNAALKEIGKSLSVALSGKFGQRSRSWSLTYSIGEETEWGLFYGANALGQITRFRSLAGYIWEEKACELAADAVPAIASWITSHGRMRLLEGIRCAGWQHASYCDTDAIIVDAVGRKRLIDGGLHVEGEWGKFGDRWGPCAVDIRGIKHYVCNGAVTCAGLPKGSFQDVGDGLHYLLSDSPSSQLRNGVRPNANSRLIAYATKEQYRHGHVNSDGKVIPFRLNGNNAMV